MRLVGPLDFRDAFTDERVRDDELRFAIIALLRDLKGVEKLLHVLAVDLLDVESVRFESRAGIFALRLLRCRVECDGIGIVDEDQIIETKVTRKRARFRRNAFLHATIAGQTNHMLIENSVLVGVETRGCHLHRHSDPDRIAHPLPERTGRAFHARRLTKLRMPRRLAVQLPEPFDLRHRQVVTAHV